MRGDMANIISSSLFLKAAGVNGFISDTAVTWETCSSSEVEHDQRLRGSSPSIIECMMCPSAIRKSPRWSPNLYRLKVTKTGGNTHGTVVLRQVAAPVR